MNQYYIVEYTGPFGFIKPWTAVRDGKTFSQQFLTPSIVEGIEKKLFPDLLGKWGIHKIKRHRLTYEGIDLQQERTQARGWKFRKKTEWMEAERPRSILTRGIMLSPRLSLAFSKKEDATIAAQQHICLCRNEDILLPSSHIKEVEVQGFDDPEHFSGFELLFEEGDDSFLVGFNRMQNSKPMYGRIHVVK